MKDMIDEYMREQSEENGFVEELLPGENVLWTGAPDRGLYIMGKIRGTLLVAILFLVFDSVFIAMALSFVREMPTMAFVGMAAFFALHLLPVWITIGQYIKASRTVGDMHYTLTDRTLYIRENGLVSIELGTVRGIDITISQQEKQKNRGTLVLSCDVGLRHITSISEPEDTRRLFMDAISSAPKAEPLPILPGEGWTNI